jgi:putative oxidoreductase
MQGLDFHGLEWMFTIVLAIVFLVTGVNKVFRYEQSRKIFPWVADVPRVLAQVIGIAEILGALGLILPVATGILPWLTPVAAVSLALLMFMASLFHAQRREWPEAALNLVLLLFLAIVAYSRWGLVPW